MKFFIQDVAVVLVHVHEVSTADYAHVFHAHEPLNRQMLAGDVLFRLPDPDQLRLLLRLLQTQDFPELRSVTLTAISLRQLQAQVKGHFRIVRAAGGLVVKDGFFLMIHRLGKWDLPKGKLEGPEKSKKGAVREVEEECNVRVQLDVKICTTWHTYARHNRQLLKRTRWYLMHCLDDSQLQPQRAEGIDDVRWLAPGEVEKLLPHSYATIREVFRQYREKFVHAR